MQELTIGRPAGVDLQLPGTELLFEASRQIPGSVQYSIRRYARPEGWDLDEISTFRYQYNPSDSTQRQLELRFCVTGNMYCRAHQSECGQCRAHRSMACEEKVESVDLIQFTYTATLLEQFVGSRASVNSL